MNKIFRGTACLMRPWRVLLQTSVALFALALSGAANAIPSTATVTSDVNPSVFGQSVTLSVTVVCDALIPTGTASFFQGATLMGVVPLSAGAAALSTSALPIGPSFITVIYSGDINCDPAAGGVTQNVNQAATTTTLTGLPNPSVYGQPVTLTATVAVVPPGAGTPTGTVSFFNGATLLGTVALDGSGQATFITNALAAATNSITATYNGDVQFGTSTSAVLAQVVGSPAAIPTLGTSAAFLLAAMLAGLAFRSHGIEMYSKL